MEETDSDRHSSLLSDGMNNGSKKFYSSGLGRKMKDFKI